MDARELKIIIVNHLEDMTNDIGDTFDVEFDTDHEEWKELTDNIVNTLFEIQCEQNR